MKTLVLLRHGQSVWNKENRFTGWVDVALSSEGIEEAKEAGRQLKGAGFVFDLAFTSPLKRCVETLDLALGELGQTEIETRKTWRLNERHYGALQGLNKSETAKKYGEEQVKMWRRSFKTVPPPLSDDSFSRQLDEPICADAPKDHIPRGESLEMAMQRIIPYFKEEIFPAVSNGRSIIVSATGNGLRSVAKYLENTPDEEILNLNIPTGIPIIYGLDDNLQFVSKKYLASDEELNAAIRKVADQGKAM